MRDEIILDSEAHRDSASRIRRHQSDRGDIHLIYPTKILMNGDDHHHQEGKRINRHHQQTAIYKAPKA
jgi:hypothetical protein